MPNTDARNEHHNVGRQVSNWAQCSSSLQPVLCQLRNFWEQPSSRMNSPWTSVESQFACNQLRAPHELEPHVSGTGSTPLLVPMDLPQGWQGWAYGEPNTSDSTTGGNGHVGDAFPPVPLSRIDGAASYNPTMTTIAGGHSMPWPQEPESVPWAVPQSATIPQIPHLHSPAPSASTTLASRTNSANSTFLLYLEEQAQAQHHRA